jgi:hypothetical protein
MSLIALVYEYRSLLGACELGLGLDWEGIDRVAAIEARFAPVADEQWRTSGRRFRREAVAMTGQLRVGRRLDQVEVVELGLGGVVCLGGPAVSRGEAVELLVEIGFDGAPCVRYHFNARGAWGRRDGAAWRTGLALTGVPVCVRLPERVAA